jgi:hypothetical protein
LLEKFLGSHSHFWKSHPTQIAHFQHLCHSKQRGTKNVFPVSHLRSLRYLRFPVSSLVLFRALLWLKAKSSPPNRYLQIFCFNFPVFSILSILSSGLKMPFLYLICALCVICGSLLFQFLMRNKAQ